jgi:hypothetical protein
MTKTKLTTFHGENYYKVYNILTETLRMDLLRDCDNFILKSYNSEQNQKKVSKLDTPEESKLLFSDKIFKYECWDIFTGGTLNTKNIKELLKKECWRILIKEIFSRCLEYQKFNRDDKKLYLENCWVNRVGNYPKEDEKLHLCLHEQTGLYTETEYHMHKHFYKSPYNIPGVAKKGEIITNSECVGAIYYLQNQFEECGTIIRCPNGEIIMDGRQNSLSIFSPELYHSPLIPDRKTTANYPRYVIVVGFRNKNIPKNLLRYDPEPKDKD